MDSWSTLSWSHMAGTIRFRSSVCETNFVLFLRPAAVGGCTVGVVGGARGLWGWGGGGQVFGGAGGMQRCERGFVRVGRECVSLITHEVSGHAQAVRVDIDQQA